MSINELLYLLVNNNVYVVGNVTINSTGARKNNDWIYVFKIEVLACSATCMWIHDPLVDRGLHNTVTIEKFVGITFVLL